MTRTRFDATDAESRRALFTDAIAAHRDRASPFVTIEVDPASVSDPDLGVPWIQFAEGIVNVDCTDDELEALKSLLSAFPAFTIDDLTRPEDAKGVNVRVRATADDDRIADFLDRTLERVYGLDSDYRAWVVSV